MDLEPTLRQLVRHLVEMHEEMVALERDARTVRASGITSARLQILLGEWERLQHEWVTQRLPSLAAAMKLALEVYDTFGPGPLAVRLGTDSLAGYCEELDRRETRWSAIDADSDAQRILVDPAHLYGAQIEIEEL